jgi:hypothetical protein
MRESAGNFLQFAGNFALRGLKNAHEIRRLRRNSLLSETGNFFQRAGKLASRAGIIGKDSFLSVSVACSHACFAPVERDLFSLAFLQK